MAKAQKGDRVTINFTGTLEDGTVFDTTLTDGEHKHAHEHEEGCDDCGCETGPMELVLGNGDFFEQLEEALIGMAPGEKKTITIAAADAFGEYDDDKVFTVDRDQVPEDLNPEIGQELELTDEDDETVGVAVIDMDDKTITFDSNHPLAGEDLTFEFELVEILPA
jgi:peptidylprolyl isomerase